MQMYIKATGNISPQKTFGQLPLIAEPVSYSGNRLACIEPDYKELIDVKLIRRMSRIIRMGVAAAMECLREGRLTVPDAIVTGTAYGCMEDTGLFLGRMVEFNEELLTPTAFIQSTHNTIGAQIGLMLQCTNYNNAFVHRGFSFESALLDAMLLLKEKEAAHVLVGAVDEITNNSHAILSRMGMYKNSISSNLDIYQSASKGTIAGEGAAFFLLSEEHDAQDYARLDALHTLYKPAGNPEVIKEVQAFLSLNNTTAEEIDLLITGNNGDYASDNIYRELKQSLFPKKNNLYFKNLCGEYPTAISFALWLAVSIIKNGKVPLALQSDFIQEKSVKKILIYNHYLGIHHSFILLSAC